MSQQELLGDIIIAIVKHAGGQLEISKELLKREPHEAVYVEYTDNGVQLTLKNREIIEIA